MEEAPAEAVANTSTDVQEAEMEETAKETTEETVADVSASEPQDQEMKIEESTKGIFRYLKLAQADRL